MFDGLPVRMYQGYALSVASDAGARSDSALAVGRARRLHTAWILRVHGSEGEVGNR